jgi:hypothetical protein
MYEVSPVRLCDTFEHFSNVAHVCSARLFLLAQANRKGFSLFYEKKEGAMPKDYLRTIKSNPSRSAAFCRKLPVFKTTQVLSSKKPCSFSANLASARPAAATSRLPYTRFTRGLLLLITALAAILFYLAVTAGSVSAYADEQSLASLLTSSANAAEAASLTENNSSESSLAENSSAESSSTGNEQADATSSENSASARIIYHFVDPSMLSETPDYSTIQSDSFSVTAGELRTDNNNLYLRANANPGALALANETYAFRVIKDYASTSENGAGPQDITNEASYNEEDGIISLPLNYQGTNLTVVWYISSNLEDISIPTSFNISKTIGGAASSTSLEAQYRADTQSVNLKLFDSIETANQVQNIRITQGGQELTQYVYQNGALCISASPLGGTISVEVDDGQPASTEAQDTESSTKSEKPLLSIFSAENPVVGERFTIDANSALIRTCESGGNMASVCGWPEKSGTYGFAVHFNTCSNPEVVNADQNHVAPGGTCTTPGGGTYDYNWIAGMHFAWGDCYGDVDNNGAGEPVVQSGWVEVTGVDYNTQTVSYRYFLDVCSDVDGHNMQSIIGTFQVHEDLAGYIKINKQSALPDISNNNPCYSLGGAQYGVYTEEACTNLKTTLTTGEDGSVTSTALPVGTYYVKEINAPSGYALDTEVHSIAVKAGTTQTLNLEDIPQSTSVSNIIAKFDSKFPYNSKTERLTQGAASLEGAEFSMEFYPSLDANYENTQPLRSWILKTNEDGLVYMETEETCKVSGGSFFKDSHGYSTLPLGTYVIRETKAPEGYNINPNTFVKVLDSIPNSYEHTKSFGLVMVSEEVIRGGLEVDKLDLESGLSSALGSADLDNTTFIVMNDNYNPVYVNGVRYARGETCATIQVQNGQAKLDATSLPYGRYCIREVSAGNGYNVSETQQHYFNITTEGEIVAFTDSNKNERPFKNQVKRGDISFTKVHESSGKRLAGIPFRITSNTTGETHVVVTDANGMVDTSASWISHSTNTNGYDEGDYSTESGTWFGKTAAGTTTNPNDKLGALPFDTYTLEELRCSANEGMELVKLSFSIYKDQQKINFGVIENKDSATPWISTKASDGEDFDKLLYSGTLATINDHVSYGNLDEGQTYTMRAHLVDQASGKTIPGATGETEFSAQDLTGSVEVSIPVNLADFQNSKIVVYEELFKDNTLVAQHQELNNSEQTLAIIGPKIGTCATNPSDGSHEILNNTEAHITDTVSFKNLTTTSEYSLTGTLMKKEYKEDGTVTATALTDENGQNITAQTTFTPEHSNGTVEMQFNFDASSLEADSELVVFEKLEANNTEVVAHEDATDEAQTISIIEQEPIEAAETPEEVTPAPEPEEPLPEPVKEFFEKTGSSIIPWIVGLAIAFGASIGLIAFGIHQRRKANAITEAFAKTMLGENYSKRNKWSGLK